MSTDDTETSFLSFYPIVLPLTLMTSISTFAQMSRHVVLRLVEMVLGQGFTNLEI